MPTTYLWFLFDWRGRLSRKAYRIALLGLLVADRMRDLLPSDQGHAGLAFLLVTLIISMALDAKRLHDLDFSAGWIPATIAGSAIVLWLALRTYPIDPDTMALVVRRVGGEIGVADRLTPFAAATLCLAAAARGLFLSTLRGTRGPNRFDFDPRKTRAVEDRTGTREHARKFDILIAAALAEGPSETRPVQAPADTMTRVPRKQFGRRGAAA